MAATLGLPYSAGAKIAAAATAPDRPIVLWLSGQECTGCSESLLRADHPTLEHLLLDALSLDYHETLCAAAGHQIEALRKDTVENKKGRYVLVVEGAIPLADNGIYCKIGGRTMIDLVTEAAEGALAIIAIGSCASWGGVAAASPNPTHAVGAPEALKGKTVVTIPGCPPNPHNFIATVLHLLTFGKAPALDDKGRPLFAYGKRVHDHCERRAHFNAGRFAERFGDEGHRQGWCLYKLGCKGPETYANCPSLRFSDGAGGVWPVSVGHPCFGCTEQGVGFSKGIHQLAEVQEKLPSGVHPNVDETRGQGVTTLTAALTAGAVGAAVGAAGVGLCKMERRNLSCELPPDKSSDAAQRNSKK
ncbi:putative hydrogenase (NiFe) small subunit HydA [Magnetofaba australis IT-1]|uniref:hydrogenase (acceptor) n=1 Tax=Magnetofaba australis IT-1 TaxID=1434232 RepID=A0A1Y2K3U8_9PROT|nr:putative hydrogenase (NiFe) small subunit HydA [Magnetofaba australis IT-1]